MSLQWFLKREVPDDTVSIGRMILPPLNPYRQIGDRFNELFPEESAFAPLYFDTGRGAMPPLLMALVTVFQMLEKVPDRLAAEYVVSRIDWKYALHLPLAYTGFHFTDLYAFRQRLLEHDQERLLFEEFLLQLKKLGLLKARGQMRTDSTHVLGVVQRLSQLELLTESLRVALQAVTALAAEWVTQTLPPAFAEDGHPSGRQVDMREVQGHDFAVHDRLARPHSLGQSLGNFRELRRQLVLVARYQPRLALFDECQGAVAVPLHLEKPLFAIEGLIHQRGQHGPDAPGHRRPHHARNPFEFHLRVGRP